MAFLFFKLVVDAIAGIITFVATWRKLDDPREMQNMTPESKELWDVKFIRGFDGKSHLRPMSYHLRIPLALIPALLMATLTAWGQNHFYH